MHDEAPVRLTIGIVAFRAIAAAVAEAEIRREAVGDDLAAQTATRTRKAREELGLDLSDWHALGSVESRGYGKRTTVICFEARSPERALTVDAGEIEEARWFDLADLPVPIGLDARVVLTRLVQPAG